MFIVIENGQIVKHFDFNPYDLLYRLPHGQSHELNNVRLCESWKNIYPRQSGLEIDVRGNLGVTIDNKKIGNRELLSSGAILIVREPIVQVSLIVNQGVRVNLEVMNPRSIPPTINTFEIECI
jgi:hypothetical protein